MRIENGDIYLESNEKVITEKIVASGSGGLLLEDDGGNYFKINDGGIVDISKPSCASGYRNGNQTINSATYTKVNLNAEEYDEQGEFDSSVNYRFTATKAGYYLILAEGCIYNLSNSNLLYCTIRKNGTNQNYWIWPIGVASTPAYPISDILKLDANDYVELVVRHNYGSSRSCYGYLYYTFLTIHKLS